MSDLIERLRREARLSILIPSCDESALEAAVVDLAALAHQAAEEITTLRAENARLKSEAVSMWRGGVSNTVTIVDQVRNKFAKGLKLKKNVRLAHFDAELDIALGEWFNATRRVRPKSYHESEDVFHALAKIKGGPDAR